MRQSNMEDSCSLQVRCFEDYKKDESATEENAPILDQVHWYYQSNLFRERLSDAQ